MTCLSKFKKNYKTKQNHMVEIINVFIKFLVYKFILEKVIKPST